MLNPVCKRKGSIRMNLLLQVGMLAALAHSSPQETPDQFARRTAWWREAKFGLFIHWGVYSVPADALRGAEWFLHGARMQVKDYERFAPRFNPVRFNAAEWVRLAKQAGMKYIVITSKHHDGFCMYDTKLTDWCITRASPFRRDPLRELAEECRKQGIKLGFYYSIMDWHHPDYLPRRPWEEGVRPAAGASLDRYIEYMKGQLRELLTGYGPIAVLWFDGGWEHNAQALRSAEVNALVRSLRPSILINDRNHLPEDFSTPEQTIPADALPDGRLWETCMTMNNSWGYARNDHNWKSTSDLVRKLCDIAHKGGNFLLNVGPTELGEFPPEAVERLRQIGEWLRRNGAAIYGTQKSPWRRMPFEGRCTVRGSRLFLHVFEWPEDGVRLQDLKTPVVSARVLGTGEVLSVKLEKDADLPVVYLGRPQRVDPIVTVVELRLKGKPVVEDKGPIIRPASDGSLRLGAVDATILGTTARYESGHGHDNVGFWTNPQDVVSWTVEVSRSGDYEVLLTYACQPGHEGSTFSVDLEHENEKQSVKGEIRPTASWVDFRTISLGILTLRSPGRYVVTVRPITMPRGAVMNLKEIVLRPAVGP